MFTELEVAGFKALRGPVKCPLGTITLVYGPNSSGKTSILQSLGLLKQSSFAEVRFNGPTVSLGSFRNALAGQGRGVAGTDKISFDLAVLDGDGLRHGFGLDLQEMKNSDAGIFTRLRKSIGEGDSSRIEFVRTDRPIATARRQFPSRRPTASSNWRLVNFSIGGDEVESTAELSRSRPPIDERDIAGLLPTQFGLLRDTFSDVKFGGGLVRSGLTSLGPASEVFHRFWNSQRQHLESIRDLVYVGPTREVPGPVLVSSDRRRDRDPFGVEYLQFLEHPALVEQVNEYLSRLAIPYELVVRHFRAEANDPMLPVRMGSLWLRPTGSSVTVGLDDVGYGVSQVLPQLLAIAGDSKLGLIEQPELHLHPRLQADLADLFIATTIGRERQLLVETHSESLLLRLQRRIREGSLDPAAIRILYVLPIRDGSQSDVIQIQLAADGSFMSEWPHGFFEERFVELFGA